MDPTTQIIWIIAGVLLVIWAPGAYRRWRAEKNFRAIFRWNTGDGNPLEGAGGPPDAAAGVREAVEAAEAAEAAEAEDEGGGD